MPPRREKRRDTTATVRDLGNCIFQNIRPYVEAENIPIILTEIVNVLDGVYVGNAAKRALLEAANLGVANNFKNQPPTIMNR